MQDQQSKMKITNDQQLDSKIKNSEPEPLRMSSLRPIKDSGVLSKDASAISKFYTLNAEPNKFNIDKGKSVDKYGSDTTNPFLIEMMLFVKMQKLMEENEELRRTVKQLRVR